MICVTGITITHIRIAEIIAL
ncbi:hypothetical protein CP061683_0638, partial [Chlamydia psittaci 06-1683]